MNNEGFKITVTCGKRFIRPYFDDVTRSSLDSAEDGLKFPSLPQNSHVPIVVVEEPTEAAIFEVEEARDEESAVSPDKIGLKRKK